MVLTPMKVEEVIVGNSVDAEIIVRASEDMDAVLCLLRFSARQGR